MPNKEEYTHLLMRNNADLEHLRDTLNKNFHKQESEYSKITNKYEDLFHQHYKDKEALIERIGKLENFVYSELKKHTVIIGLIEVCVSTILASIIASLISYVK